LERATDVVGVAQQPEPAAVALIRSRAVDPESTLTDQLVEHLQRVGREALIVPKACRLRHCTFLMGRSW
jgi:hypothetical protein